MLKGPGRKYSPLTSLIQQCTCWVQEKDGLQKVTMPVWTLPDQHLLQLLSGREYQVRWVTGGTLWDAPEDLMLPSQAESKVQGFVGWFWCFQVEEISDIPRR